MNIICAFSSDSRDLYKADIYRVLALPEKHIIHFRYKKKYVDNNLLAINDINNRQVAIFFTHGNNLNSSDNTFSNHSIRLAKITKIELSDTTDVYHVYMSLDRFCNITIDSENSKEKMPPTKFFSELSCSMNPGGNEWHERIMEIKDLFPEIMFFQIKGIKNYKSKEIIKSSIQNEGKSNIYDLIYGNRYILELAVSNQKNADSKLEITNSSQDIIINCINPFESSIQFDDHDILFSVKSLQVSNQASLLEFKPITKNNDQEEYVKKAEYNTNIELNLKLGLERPMIFGFFSTIAFWAVLLAKPISITDITSHYLSLFFSSVLFFIASSSLFLWFNKK